MGFEKINENLYLTTDETFYDVVAGAIVLPTKLVMVDSGINLIEMKKFREWVEKSTGKKFEILTTTHFHGDHSYGNQIFKDCKIIVPKIHQDYMKLVKEWLTEENLAKEKSRMADPKALDGLEIIIPADTFEDQYTITDENVEVIIKHTGGHTIDSSYVYCPQYKILFTGDNLFVNSNPYGGHSTCNPDVWMDVYKEFLSLDVDIIVPGHGPITDKKYIEKSLKEFEDIKKEMKELVKKKIPKEDIVKKIYNNYFKTEDEDTSLEYSTVNQFYKVWIEEQ